MKKIIFCLTLILIGISNVKAQIGVSDLKNDKEFVSFIENYYTNVFKLIEGYSKEELIVLNNELSSKENAEETEKKLERISLKLKYSNKDELINANSKIASNFKELQNKYGKRFELISGETLQNAILEILEETKTSDKFGKYLSCGWRCKLCIVAAGVEGFLMMDSCLILAGVTAGIATPAAIACAIATAAWTANAVLECDK
jgi:hypothetical protein